LKGKRCDAAAAFGMMLTTLIVLAVGRAMAPRPVATGGSHEKQSELQNFYSATFIS
jgi:hypothetical protein